MDRLRNLLPGDWEFKKSFPDLSALTFWAVQGRYPGDFPMATEIEASDALLLAENLMREVKGDIDKVLDA